MNNFGGFKVKTNENYVYHSYRKFHPILCIYDAGILYPDKNYNHTKNNRYPDYLFEYIVSGKGYIECGGEKYKVTAGDCIFINKNCEVTYYSDKEDPYTKMWFTTDGALTGKLCEAVGFSGNLYITKKHMYEKFLKMLHTLEKDGFELDNIAKQLLGIMLEMFAKSDTFIPQKADGNEATLSDAARIKAYIDVVLESAPTVKQIADHFGICEATVIRRFRNEFGETPNNYTKRQRMNLAEALIRNTDYSVTKIAKLLNFCSQSYFSDMFYETFEMYPSEYRKKLFETSARQQ